MRAMFRHYVVGNHAKINFRNGSYVLESYRDIPLPPSQQQVVAQNVGVGFVEGRMNRGFFWTLASKDALWSGKTDLLVALETHYGPREICFQCVWFDADKPSEHPEVAGQLDRNRRFAEIVYHWYYPSQMAKPPPKTAVFAVGGEGKA